MKSSTGGDCHQAVVVVVVVVPLGDKFDQLLGTRGNVNSPSATNQSVVQYIVIRPDKNKMVSTIALMCL